ncbi:probable E3 ubiquitin-protein ligase MARCHF10 [Scomber scombrus]|uniref:Probable E3 ubiquitin-protein ligase MARCHF10 n=1 Tax=Scomber scombrus TaxID=13677 RepID=A0AAV1NCG8_SCOSC
MFEHVESRVLNGSTHGEASKQTQSQDILRSKNKTRHHFNKANTEEIIDSEHSSSAETLDNFLGDIAAVPQLSRLDTVSGKSEEEELEDDLLASWQDTYGASDYITVETTASRSNSASSSHSHSPHTLSLSSPS